MTHILPLHRILPAVVACIALLAAGGKSVSAQEKTNIEKLSERVVELEKKQGSALDNLNSSVAILQGEIISLRGAISDLKDKLDAKAPNTSDGTPRRMPKTAVDELREKLEGAQRDITDLKAQLKKGTSTSQKADSGATTLLPARSGQLHVVNTFGSVVTLSVNGRLYSLAPMEEKTLVVPVGLLSYQMVPFEVYSHNHTIREGDVVNVNIHY